MYHLLILYEQLYCYNPGLSTLFITDISIQCSDDANTIIIYIVGTGLWTRFAGVCSIINASSVKKCGIDISHGFCALGSDSANNTIGFKGNFTHVLYGTSHSTWNIAYGENKTQKMFFDGIADNLIYSCKICCCPPHNVKMICC